jgi:hypothetical protein
MRQKSGPVKESAEKVVMDIRRATRRHFSAEDKIRVVLEGPYFKPLLVPKTLTTDTPRVRTQACLLTAATKGLSFEGAGQGIATPQNRRNCEKIGSCKINWASFL